MTTGYMLFETSLGRCGIVWGERGVVGVQLPEGGENQTRARVLRRFPGAKEQVPPPPVMEAMDGIAGLLRGEDRDLSRVGLDMEQVPPFHRRVYRIARTVARGNTVSYGEIAARLG